MRSFSPTRDLRLALAAGVSLACAVTVYAQGRGGGIRGQGLHQPAFRQAAPVERGAPAQGPQGRGPQSQLAPIVRRNPQAQAQGVRGEHLAQWMNQHRNLTPQQQQQALDREPGFHQLPQATQQRMRNHLAQLDAMNPRTRERTQSHIEWMERLSPDQRSQVRGSMEQLGSLPPDQRRAVAQTFRNLRALPPEQRGAMLNSPQYQYMNPAQRAALNNLLRVEPLIPPD